MQATIIEVAPVRPAASIKGMFAIYALSALSCFALNRVVHLAPIGPWQGADVEKMYWLDNVTWQLLALWWALLSIVSGHYPFHRIENPVTRGVVTMAAAWGLGWLSAKAIYWTGLGADWVFPIVGCIYFFITFFSFTGENWLVAHLAPPRQFLILLMLIAFLTYAVTHSAIRWIPAWWFPFVEMGLASGLLAYLTRGLAQPARSFVQIGMLFVVVMIALWISARLNLWDPALPGVGGFWALGSYVGAPWLLWFMVACSVSHGFLIQLYNWPFSKIPMPWGGLLACAFCIVAAWLITEVMLAMVGPVFADSNEALTYGYMGVHWSFLMALLFGFGLDRPYLWAGQKTPGSWDDVA